jgi:hypothetical protein
MSWLLWVVFAGLALLTNQNIPALLLTLIRK